MSTVSVSTELQADADVVFDAVTTVDAFTHVTRGLLTYLPARGRRGRMHEGDELEGWLLLGGVVPFSRHRLRIERIDPAERVLRSDEGGGAIRSWRHLIRVTPLAPGRCRYEDVIEIDAGPLTPAVRLFAVASAVALGAPRVVYVDQDAERLRLAAAFGAEVVEAPLDDLPRDERFAVTVDASGLDEGREHAIRSTKPNGTCTSVSGGITPRASLPLQSMYAKGITYEVGRVHARATAPEVLDLVASGALDPGIAIGRTVPFDDAIEAMTAPDVKLVLTAAG
ncbi:MAG: zinc-binding dehydrogenase [Acidimicrobiia bacterium]